MGDRIVLGVGRQADQGYTLIELIVVMVLISLFLGLGMPRIRDIMLHDDLKSSARRIIAAVNSCRQAAVKNQKGCDLHFDIGGNAYWLELQEAAEAPAETDGIFEIDDRGEDKKQLSDEVRILDVWSQSLGKQTIGEGIIRFTKKGYAEKAFINLESDNGANMALEINSFISDIQVHDSYQDVN